jgi:hypothetical protein
MYPKYVRSSIGMSCLDDPHAISILYPFSLLPHHHLFYFTSMGRNRCSVIQDNRLVEIQADLRMTSHGPVLKSQQKKSRAHVHTRTKIEKKPPASTPGFEEPADSTWTWDSWGTENHSEPILDDDFWQPTKVYLISEM